MILVIGNKSIYIYNLFLLYIIIKICDFYLRLQYELKLNILSL